MDRISRPNLVLSMEEPSSMLSISQNHSRNDCYHHTTLYMESLGLLPIVQAMGSSGYQLTQVKGINGAFANTGNSTQDIALTTFNSSPDLCLIHIIRTKSYPNGAPANSKYTYSVHGWVALLNDPSKIIYCDTGFAKDGTDTPGADSLSYTIINTGLRLTGTVLYACDIGNGDTRDLSMMVYAFKKA